MNYYDECIAEIKELISKEDYKEARFKIETERHMPYLPREFEKELTKLEALLPTANKDEHLEISEIEKYLFSDTALQARAVLELQEMNLRNQLELIQHYLLSVEGDLSCKVYLLRLLKQQDIKAELKILKKGEVLNFNTEELELAEDSPYFMKMIEALQAHFFKEPVKFDLAMQLLAEHLNLILPGKIKEEDCEEIVSKVIEELEQAFIV